ncbi:hypothetical protein PYCCODRAFT_1334379, partial [Trametes coccinea BRFM310]
MKAFISTLLGYDPKSKSMEGGVLGLVKAYYGCVEAQGRGTLHCHMMIWVEGGLNPSDMKERLRGEDGVAFGQRLICFLDDTISTSIPPPYDEGNRSEVRRYKASKKPLTHRGVDLALSPESDDVARQRREDLRLLVACCQHHEHTATCYKYQKEGDSTAECRFELDAENFVPETTVDPETGHLTLRCLDGLINNYNATILEAMRCNMDIKFIGTGEDAKAVIYYVTDYITKSQLKTHVAYAALALGVKKATEAAPSDDSEESIKAKRMLQKCAFSLVANQEMSAQQVATYLLDYEDHYTSDTFANLYWPSFERYLDRQHPSPECRYDSHTSNSAAQGDDVDDTPETLDEEVDDTEEVIVSTNDVGDVVPVSSQVADYVYRGSELENICLWDFVAQTKK